MNKICYGCGAKLQSTDKDTIGYVPENRKEDAKYCMRCFRMTHYGDNKLVETPKDVREIVNKVNKDVRFVIFLVDFLNLNENVVRIFKSIKKRKLLVVNKCELIPNHINLNNVGEYIVEHYDIKDPIKLKGGKKTHGAKSIYNYLEKNDIHEAYILGVSNSGKSTFINDLIDVCDAKISKTTVNNKANTTVDFIRVKLNDDYTVIDSPGFILPNSLNNDVTCKNITAYNFNMKTCETIGLLDNQYFLKFDDDTPITFYTNADNDKVIKKYFKAAPGLTHTIEIKNDNTDLVLFGIGFVSVKYRCTITTNIDPKYIEVRDSMFGYIHE